MNVGQRITELREARGLTTNKLANICGISQSYLREVELGNKNPTVEMMGCICFGLKISLQHFFDEPGAERINPVLLTALESLTLQEQVKLAEFIVEMKTK